MKATCFLVGFFFTFFSLVFLSLIRMTSFGIFSLLSFSTSRKTLPMLADLSGKKRYQTESSSTGNSINIVDVPMGFSPSDVNIRTSACVYTTAFERVEEAQNESTTTPLWSLHLCRIIGFHRSIRRLSIEFGQLFKGIQRKWKSIISGGRSSGTMDSTFNRMIVSLINRRSSIVVV